MLDKSGLAGDLRVVQSVAYLEGLGKLYAAEFTALGSFAGFSAAAAPSSGDSQVVEIAPSGSRTVAASFTGENIAKLLSFRAADGRDYLLLAARTTGRILRFDPARRQFQTVVSGLKEPSALVLDPSSGDLLVAENDRVTTIGRAAIESGLAPVPLAARRILASAPPAAAAPLAQIAGAAGLAVDQCTGKLYATLPVEGLLVEYHHATGALRTVLSGLSDPGALLGFYRAGVSCPDSFHLLLSERGRERTLVVLPASGAFSDWVPTSAVGDLVVLPAANAYTGREGVLIGENTGATGALSVVETASLYDARPPNPPEPDVVEPRADLALTAAAAPEPVAVLGMLTYTFSVANNGPAAASSVFLTDRLPAELQLVSATTPQGTCASRSGTVECSLGSIAANGRASVTVRATVVNRPAAGAIVNTVSVAGVEIDPDVSNNTSTVRTTVAVPRAARLELAGIPDPSAAGTASSVTVTARDASGTIAPEYTGTVRFTSTDAAAALPADYTFTTRDGGTHTFAGGVTLRTSGRQTVTVTDTAAAALTGTQSVTVSAASAAAAELAAGGLPNPVAAGAAAGITVTARDASGRVAAGYTGTVRFTSNDAAATLPGDYTFTAADAGVHTFALTLRTAGTRTVTVTDTAQAALTGSQTVTV
ncbi:MAG TPA: hypothetical protein VGJ70_13420, partial [Solirubrobacteraceae bacterium]